MSDKICVLDKDYLEIWKYFDKIDETNETKYFHLYKLKSVFGIYYTSNFIIPCMYILYQNYYINDLSKVILSEYDIELASEYILSDFILNAYTIKRYGLKYCDMDKDGYKISGIEKFNNQIFEPLKDLDKYIGESLETFIKDFILRQHHIYLLWNTFDLLDRILKIEKEADNAE